MKAALKRYAARIDAATLRERVLFFAAAAIALAGVIDVFGIDPLRAKERQLTLRLQQYQSDLKTVQTQVQAAVRGGNPADAARKRLADLSRRMSEIDASIAAEQKRFTPPERMRPVLEELLERNRKLRLVDLKTLPRTALEGGSGPSAQRVYRHGVEITVSGAYFDLRGYLLALEKLPAQLYWGRAELSVAEYPRATLKLTVYTLSFDRSWMLV